MITFRNLFPLGSVRGKELISHCSAMLPNRMQCTKGGTWEVTDDLAKPPTKKQYCTFHARMLEQELKDKGIEYTAPEVNTTGGFSESQVKTTTEKLNPTEEKINEQSKPNLTTSKSDQ